ncbi:MAG TPA: GPW/gp25 family protein [Paludibacteraceae bacterium]|nr:GPW/gp25 family protein [Paludibacteraceae bacterium]HOU67067.1 GPW/gp25 family protein [Paludibacteraceae bacterium]HPH62949.1 GPW/gp25 family protein [Paludibacteraceae bacterium]HQF49239.1 GPW/gp25 family protein [Paludibacteraceae bacterium]HQJ90126.1 GPW/gp25 family protein [Paludibacteraceae bacterium]
MSSENYLGTGWGFPPQFKKGEKSVVMVSEEADVKESLCILLSTKIKERFVHPEFGADLSDFAFKSMDFTTLLRIKRLISTAIDKYEPRVSLDDVSINSDNEQEGVLMLNIEYTILATYSKESLVYPFYLEND